FRIDRNDPGTTFLETPVPSPLSGWLGRLMVTNVGAQITPNEPLATVVDDAFLRSRVYVPASDWTKISHDTRVTVTVNGVAREGKVVAIARAAQAESGRGSLVVEVPNEDQQWRAGMVAHITLEVEPRERILINASALTITDK